MLRILSSSQASSDAGGCWYRRMSCFSAGFQSSVLQSIRQVQENKRKRSASGLPPVREDRSSRETALLKELV